MTLHRNINGWHLLSLVLAFVAGAAIFSNPKWFGNSSTDNNAGVELVESTAAQRVEDVASVVEDKPAVETTALTKPIDIPLYLENELEDLREQTEMAREQIDELKETVSELSAEVEGGSFSQDNVNASQNAGSEQQPAAAPAQNRGRRNRGINRDALAQAGVDAVVIDTLQQRQDEQRLARLDLLDRAAREGYSGTERLDNELDLLRESSPDLQEELGDDAYDQYLFNAGTPNRIRVSSIINGSIADLAGIQLGDVIYSYSQTRVFNTRGLVAAIREGVRDEPVIVNIIRDGQPLVFDVTRAPLGVTLTGIRLEPGF